MAHDAHFPSVKNNKFPAHLAKEKRANLLEKIIIQIFLTRKIEGFVFRKGAVVE